MRAVYAYVGGNPISRTDPLGLMCVAGVGCYTTPAERAVAQSGNAVAYYQLACADGDAYACFAQHVAAADSFLGRLATDLVLYELSQHPSSNSSNSSNSSDCPENNDQILNDIRSDLANAYANYLPDNPDNAIWPDANAIAQFHQDVFAQYGLPANTFGGTFLGNWGGLFGASIWCPNCGTPRPPHAGMH